MSISGNERSFLNPIVKPLLFNIQWVSQCKTSYWSAFLGTVVTEAPSMIRMKLYQMVVYKFHLWNLSNPPLWPGRTYLRAIIFALDIWKALTTRERSPRSGCVSFWTLGKVNGIPLLNSDTPPPRELWCDVGPHNVAHDSRENDWYSCHPL